MNEYEAGVVVILFIWSCVLVWASLQLRRASRQLELEAQSLSRWARIRRVAERQNVKWQ